jgi:predicted secreted protein
MKYPGRFPLLLLLFLSCCAMKKITHAKFSVNLDKGQAQLSVHKDDTIVVKMPMVAGTGFVWQIQGKPSTCILSAVNYEKMPKGLMGGTTRQEFSLIATTKGQEDIKFFYSRPFEKGHPPVNTSILHLTVE